MNTNRFEHMKLALVISLLVVLYGFTMGGIFGAYEDNIKDFLRQKVESVKELVYNNDEALMEKVSSKSWEYFKQSHTHAVGLGPVALILIVVLSCFSMKPVLKYIVSLMIALGALGYPLYWLLAGIKAPLIGNTHLTKESLAYIAKPSAGLLIIGLFSIILIVIIKFVSGRK